MIKKSQKNKEAIHPAVLDLQSDFYQGKMNRRQFLHLATLLGTSVVTAYGLAGCRPQSVSPTVAPPLKINRGGTIRVGTEVYDIRHPAHLDSIESANQVRQVGEYLTETGPDNLTRPWLLERWEVDETVKTWTLHLRPGITFNNGQPLTADDLIFNFQQWLDPTIASSMRSLLYYLNRNNIERVDEYTVRLHLNEPQIGVPEHLFHYPAVILPRTFEGDFTKHPIGTGPFNLVEFVPGERAVFKRRPDYWRLGADGDPLPYLDEIIYIHLEPHDRGAAIQGGAIDTLYMPNPNDWQALKETPNLNINSVSTARTLVLRMRVDQPPWDNVLVRQALKLCQDRAMILARSYAGQGDLAIDAHVAPSHPAYCEKPIPAYDPTQARALLAEAGYSDNLPVKLITTHDFVAQKMAETLKSLAVEGGFDIELSFLDQNTYLKQWRDFNLAITTWMHRPLSTMVLSLAYTVDETGQPGPWNETRWIDEAFNHLLTQAGQALDVNRRRAILCQLEDIMQERGPIGISYWQKTWNIVSTKFQNVRAHPTGYDFLYDVWKRA